MSRIESAFSKLTNIMQLILNDEARTLPEIKQQQKQWFFWAIWCERMPSWVRQPTETWQQIFKRKEQSRTNNVPTYWSSSPMIWRKSNRICSRRMYIQSLWRNLLNRSTNCSLIRHVLRIQHKEIIYYFLSSRNVRLYQRNHHSSERLFCGLE